jgi:hypothetical protein
MRGSPRRPLDAVMIGEPGKGQVDDDLAGTRRPAAIALDLLEPFEEAAQIDEEVGEISPDGAESGRHPLPGGDHDIACAGVPAARPTGRIRGPRPTGS